MDEEVEIILQQDSVEVTEPLVADYILPTATTNTLGGVKIGNNVSIDSSGHLSVPIASGSTAGVVKVGSGLAIDAEGVLSSNGGYTLPQATKTALGGVYVDDELNDSSLNPVQNAVISLELDSLSDDIDDLTTTVGGLDDDIDDLSTTVGGMSSTLNDLGDTVTGQSNTINDISGYITSYGSDITTLQDDVDNLQTGLGETSQHVGELMVDIDETVDYTDVANYWTSGNINLTGKGKIAYINVNLEGSLTIASGNSEDLYTILQSAFLPAYQSRGMLVTDAGVLSAVAFTDGTIKLYNISSSSMTITKLSGNIPIILT